MRGSTMALLGLALLLAFSAKGEDLTSKRVLIVGDSLSVGKGSFGGRLKKLITDGGAASVTLIAIGGSSARSIRDKALFRGATYGKSYDVCFILLGTNDAANVVVGADFDKTVASFEALKKTITADRFIGAGAPSYGPKARERFQGIDLVAKRLNEAIEPFFDEFVSLFDLTQLPEFESSYRTGDGVHFTGKGYEFLAREFYERL